jgi:hypothetical protein
MKVDYKDATGKLNAAEISLKGDSAYIKKLSGGCEKYDAYIYDMKQHNLTCISMKNPKTAVAFNTDKVLPVYEKNKLKADYKVHYSQKYTVSKAVAQVNGIPLKEERCNDGKMLYVINVGPAKINYSALIPVLRIADFWNNQEEGNSNIIVASTIDAETQKKTSINVSITPGKVNVKLFDLPKDIQKVDINKILTDKATSPKLPELVKGLAGF